MQQNIPDNNSDGNHRGSLQKNVRGVLIVQFIVTIALLVLVFIHHLYSGHHLDLLLIRLAACLYGAALAITGSLLSARAVRRSSPLGDEKAVPGQAPVSLVPIFSGLLNKLVIVGGGIGFGLIVLDFDPIIVIASFLLVQISTAVQLVLTDS